MRVDPVHHHPTHRRGHRRAGASPHPGSAAAEDAFAAAAAWNRRAVEEPDLAQLVRLQGRLDRLTLPIIYLDGRPDVLGPVENAYLQEDCLPNVQSFHPDDCGHQGQTDRPEIFNQVFTEFFCSGRVSTATAEKAGVSDRRPVLDVVGG